MPLTVIPSALRESRASSTSHGGGVGLCWCPISQLQVLVADDCPIARLLTRMQLARWGIAPMLASDWDHTARLLRMHRFDVLLLDVDMPPRSGSTAASSILALRRAMVDHRHVPIVACGQGDRRRLPRSLKRLGVDGAVRKPCSDGELLACLFQSCARSLARQVTWGARPQVLASLTG